jgi:hypothetical protein
MIYGIIEINVRVDQLARGVFTSERAAGDRNLLRQA